jgi:hypothetical protein
LFLETQFDYPDIVLSQYYVDARIDFDIRAEKMPQSAGWHLAILEMMMFYYHDAGP